MADKSSSQNVESKCAPIWLDEFPFFYEVQSFLPLFSRGRLSILGNVVVHRSI